MKYLLDNQIVPDGTVADPLECANESYVYTVNRYDVDTGKFSLIYVANRANFPAPEKWTAYSWKLAFDATKQRLYWWYYAGSCAVAGHVSMKKNRLFCCFFENSLRNERWNLKITEHHLSKPS